MAKEDLVQKINIFLDESPFSDAEIRSWKEKALKMNEAQLKELFSLLQERLSIATDTNQLFIDIAEATLEEKEQQLKNVPKEIEINDLNIDDLADIFKRNLVKFVKDSKFNLFYKLNKYFEDSKLLKEDVIRDFDLLIKAINNNNEIFAGGVSVGQWLSLYNQFNDSAARKSIDRISFSNKDERAKKLNSKDRMFLLDLLKLYDYLLNPEGVVIRSEQEEVVKSRPKLGPPKTLEERDIDNLQELASQYEPGSLEYKAIQEEIEKLSNK